MSTHKNINRICVAATFFSIVLTVLLMNGRTLGLLPIVSEASSGDLFTTNDLDGNWDTASATRIVLSDSGSTISGNGAYVNGGNVYIVCAG
ncbi:MAG: hypothetical protein HDR26_06570, partial [Lachnospiraceae bacterium]|nr:hypothetical protein [Lachnospiraceae bacterium]